MHSGAQTASTSANWSISSGQPAWLLDAICLLKEGAITQAYVQHDGVKAAELFYQLLMQLDRQPSA